MSTLEPFLIAHKGDIPGVQLALWRNLKSSEIGDQIDSALFKSISIQVEGEFTGFKVQIQGSNDGEHWYTLIDSQDNHMVFIEPGIADVGQLSRWLRPEVIGGDESTNVTIWAVCRGL